MKTAQALIAIALAVPIVAPARAEPQVIAALGASDTDGKNLPRSQSFPAAIERIMRAKGYDVRVINLGVSGDSSAGMLSRLGSIPPGTKVVVLQPGTNDGPLFGMAPAQSVANVDAIVSTLRGRGMAVVLCGFRGGMGADIASRRGAIFVGNYRAGLVPRYLQPDGQHLTPEGYSIVAVRLVPAIERALASVRH
jgi:acyl-CoA thioesterase-1